MNETQKEKAMRLIAQKQGKTPVGSATTENGHTVHAQKKPTNSFSTTKATKKYMKKSPH